MISAVALILLGIWHRYYMARIIPFKAILLPLIVAGTALTGTNAKS